jgi:hypothetical protein
MSYVGLGETCPGQEVFDPDIGVCMCPPGTQTTGTIGVCSSASEVPGWGEPCPVDIPIIQNFNCMCIRGTAYDESRNMCTRAAVHTGGAPSPSGSRSSSVDLSRFGQTEISTGVAVTAVVAGLGLIYLLSQRG